MPLKKKKKSKPSNKKPGRDGGTIHAQADSRLLQLPQELRDKVYDFLFLSTRVTFGKRSTGRISSKTMKPAANSLALLRVCRRIFEETKPLWLGRILFNFESSESLLDKLSLLPLNTLSQIRYVRVRGETLMLSYDYDQDVYHRLVWTLKLLPGLRLDTLTVLGLSDGIMDYDTLGGLIRHGNCWKELRYITRDSTMLGFKREQSYRRKPQPRTWSDTLLSRDGLDSRATVAVYQATEHKTIGAPFNVSNSRPFEQQVLPPETLDIFGLGEDAHLMSDNERTKELLVVVRRGRGADITESDSPPFHAEDIRQDTYGMTWQAIKRKYLEFDGRYDDEMEEERVYLEETEVVEADAYHGVDDFVWDDTVSF